MLAFKAFAVPMGLAVAAQGLWPSPAIQKGSGMGVAVGEWHPSASDQEAGNKHCPSLAQIMSKRQGSLRGLASKCLDPQPCGWADPSPRATTGVE